MQGVNGINDATGSGRSINCCYCRLWFSPPTVGSLHTACSPPHPPLLCSLVIQHNIDPPPQTRTHMLTTAGGWCQHCAQVQGAVQHTRQPLCNIKEWWWWAHRRRWWWRWQQHSTAQQEEGQAALSSCRSSSGKCSNNHTQRYPPCTVAEAGWDGLLQQQQQCCNSCAALAALCIAARAWASWYCVRVRVCVFCLISDLPRLLGCVCVGEVSPLHTTTHWCCLQHSFWEHSLVFLHMLCSTPDLSAHTAAAADGVWWLEVHLLSNRIFTQSSPPHSIMLKLSWSVV